MRRIISILFLCLLSWQVLKTQEIVTGLFSIEKIRQYAEKSSYTKSQMLADTLELPFFDDFSGSAPYPDQSRWQDRFVFINNTYSEKQRSMGVATFDAIDRNGRLYELAVSSGFEADMLTSQPLNLNFPASEDIRLSFFYEPGGLADMPEEKDSLTLQFYAPVEDKWYSIWRSPSVTADTFRPVIILIDKIRFLKKGFRFRFKNYASLGNTTGDPAMAGNCDQWNLDYVYLARNRGSADTINADVAFTKPMRTILKTYEAMPWKQFRQVFLSEMGPRITVNYMNNDLITRNVTRTFEIFDLYKNTVSHSFSAGAANIPALTPFEYQANLIYTFNTDNPDSALFRVKSMLSTDVFDPKGNDTIVFYQHFGNYFSYDDGTAEGGYGINGLGSRNAMVALKFKSFIKDTLRAIMICFNDSYQNANLRTFDLMVWDNNSGLPGNVIYTQEDMTVSQGEGNNGYYTYILNDPVEITGEFFVGWKQRSETFLNAGFDLNSPHKGKLVYWLNGNWNVSQQKGIVMIRPVVGPEISPVSAEKIASARPGIKIWPNPATENITIDFGDIPLYSATVISISDLQGRELIRHSGTGTTDISALQPGIYIVRVSCGNKTIGFGKLLKTYDRQDE
jgi:hypothetical protein